MRRVIWEYGTRSARCAAALPDQSEKELMTSAEIVVVFMGISVCDSNELTSVSRDYATRR